MTRQSLARPAIALFLAFLVSAWSDDTTLVGPTVIGTDAGAGAKDSGGPIADDAGPTTDAVPRACATPACR